MTFVARCVKAWNMSRPLRIEYPGAWYHVMNRGRWSEKVFFSDLDHEAFAKVLREAFELWNMRISANCLMSNHYHLLVQTPGGNLSRCMRHVNGVYTQRFIAAIRKKDNCSGGALRLYLLRATIICRRFCDTSIEIHWKQGVSKLLLTITGAVIRDTCQEQRNGHGCRRTLYSLSSVR